MSNIVNDIDELIGKYLAQEATAAERSRVETWLAESEANRHYFNHLKTIFDHAASVKNLPHFDTDNAWKKLKSKIQQDRDNKIRVLKPANRLAIFWRIAATVILIAGIGYFTYQWLQPFAAYQPTEVVATSEVKTDTLPEGTRVFLNRKTNLAYSFDKQKKAHRVKLKGEAYFTISPEPEKTFLVEADGVIIKDIGTSFNVKAYPEANTIEVTVDEGEVVVYTETSPGISLRAGSKGIYNKSTKRFTEEKPDANSTAYKTKQFIFSDSNLESIVQQLNSIYEKQIVIGDNLADCRLTVTFNNEDIDEIVSVIAETLGLSIKESEGKIVLEGKGCEE